MHFKTFIPRPRSENNPIFNLRKKTTYSFFHGFWKKKTWRWFVVICSDKKQRKGDLETNRWKNSRELDVRFTREENLEYIFYGQRRLWAPLLWKSGANYNRERGNKRNWRGRKWMGRTFCSISVTVLRRKRGGWGHSQICQIFWWLGPS